MKIFLIIILCSYSFSIINNIFEITYNGLYVFYSILQRQCENARIKFPDTNEEFACCLMSNFQKLCHSICTLTKKYLQLKL